MTAAAPADNRRQAELVKRRTPMQGALRRLLGNGEDRGCPICRGSKLSPTGKPCALCAKPATVAP
jgi:hypothetical protein